LRICTSRASTPISSVRTPRASCGSSEGTVCYVAPDYFDDDEPFLALPVAWKGTLMQYAGRLHRRHPGKRDVRIFDYVDCEVPVLLRMFEKRLRGYRAMGYARGEAPLGFAEPEGDLVVAYDEDTLRALEHEAATDRDDDAEGADRCRRLPS